MHELLTGDAQRVRSLLVQRERERPLEPLLVRARALGLAVELVDHDTLAETMRASGAAPGLARGIVAIATPPRLYSIEDVFDGTIPERRTAQGRQLLVALDGVQDPQNLGAIIRSAEFFGATAVLWTRDRAVGLSPTVVRASAGATERLPLIVETNLVRAVDVCKQAEYWSIGTVVDGRPLREICAEGLPERLVVVFGSEGRGIRRLTRERCDWLATIAGAGEVGSLNVSAAAAVVFATIA
ncbi:MAG: RNA methyltransferase [Myxococcales bacterium]|nr:RNA methyltransferase [Myxococcales bacterium]MCB9754669.1 RNA methyltransferase [Myxococcales bacterium]